jgi:hypothetical protein
MKKIYILSSFNIAKGKIKVPWSQIISIATFQDFQRLI